MRTRRSPLVPPRKPWQPQPSPFARQGLICYAVLIAYGSLYPFRGWLSLGIGPFDYLFAPLPQYLTAFDVITNVLGYMPFGALFVFAIYPRWRSVMAVCLALLAGSALSAWMEAIQTYLPERVASNLDLASNALGTLLGAALAAPLARPLLERGILRRLRYMWFERRSGFLLGVLLLWPLAQMFPQPFLFGSGGWPRDAWNGLDPIAREILTIWAGGLPDLIGRFGDLASSSVWEAIVSGTAVLSAGLLGSLAMRTEAPRVFLVLALIATALLLKAAANALQSTGDTFDWVTQGAAAGVCIGTALALLTLRLPHSVRAALSLLMLVIGVALTNLLPLNPYVDVLLAGWREGRYRHFNDLAQWLAWVWPYMALAWLMLSVERAWLARRASSRASL